MTLKNCLSNEDIRDLESRKITNALHSLSAKGICRFVTYGNLLLLFQALIREGDAA